MKEINEILLRALDRLDNTELMEEIGELEIARSNSISKTAQTYLNVVKTKMQIMELAERTGKKMEKLEKELGA